MTVLGWPLQIIALAYAPLVVVQPALASGLLVLLLAGERLLGERAGPARAALGRGDRRRRRRDRGARAGPHDPPRPRRRGLRRASLLGVAAFSPFMLQLTGRTIAERRR